MKVSHFRNREETIDVKLPGSLGTISVTFRLTTDEIQSIYNRNRDEHKDSIIKRMAADLATSITKWSVTDEDGLPVPADFDLLATFDITVLAAISTSITEYMYPPKRASGNSAAGF